MIEILERDPFFVGQLSPLVVGKVRDLGDRTKIIDGIPMAFEAPPHRKHLMPGNDFHLVDSSVALDATDTTIHVGSVVEIGVVGDAVHPDPLDRKPSLVTLLDRRQLPALRSNRGMAVHAGLRGRYRRVCRGLDRVVAVTTIHAEFAGMKRMAKWNRLRRLVTDLKRLRTEAVGHKHHDVERQQRTDHR